MVSILDTLAIMLREEIIGYTKLEGYKSSSYFLESPDHASFAWVVVPDEDYPVEDTTEIPMMARIIDNYILIERDDTDRPLYKELLRRGIPREQIILRYAGEKLPETR